MKYRVISEFIDAETGETREVGTPIEVADPDRAERMLAIGVIDKGEVAEEPKAKPLGRMNKDELRAIAAEEGVEIAEDATNAQIIEAIEEARKAAATPAE